MQKNILLINPESNVSVCTLWTKKDFVLSLLPKEVRNKIAIIGTLYTPSGISHMIKTFAELNTIDTIIVYGADLSDSGKALAGIFVKKKLDNLRVDNNKAKIIVETIKMVDLRDKAKKNDYNSLIRAIEENYTKNIVSKREKMSLKIEENIGVSSWPYPVVNQRVYENSVFRAWIKILNLIYRFGVLKNSQYGESQKEVINLSVSIDLRENKDRRYEIEKGFLNEGFSIDDFRKHIEEVLTPKKPDGVEYTYGERLRNHRQGGDQIDFLIKRLAKTPYSRRGIAFTWEYGRDMNSPLPPCIIAVQGIITNNLYNHTCLIRSNDMVKGWPANMIGQIRLAEYITEEINKIAGTDYKVGFVSTVSVSAHMYEHDFNYVNNILKKYSPQIFSSFIPDIIGNILVYQEKDKIIIEHRTPDHNKILSKEEFNDFRSAYNYLKGISAFMLPSHALYIGKEIRRAFDSIERGDKYIQGQA